MFDSHIQFYAYHNTEGDDFGVGYLGNKEFWVTLVNRWSKEDSIKTRYTVEDFHDIHVDHLRGCLIAELIEVDDGYLVNWFDNLSEYCMKINNDKTIVWENSDGVGTSTPRWVNRLKNQLFDI